MSAVLLSSAVLIPRGSRFAVIRSAKHGGAAELPGGKSESGETPLDTVRREAHEETGVELIDPVAMLEFEVDLKLDDGGLVTFRRSNVTHCVLSQL